MYTLIFSIINFSNFIKIVINLPYIYVYNFTKFSIFFQLIYHIMVNV